MSQQQETGGVLQPNHDNVPSGSSEERPQLSETQIAVNEFWTGLRHNKYQPLYNAAQKGDWKIAERFLDNDPNALTARITSNAQTVLHVAALCCQWRFVLKLLERLSPESITMQDELGVRVLHYAAQGGSLNTAKALIKKNPNLLQMVDNKGILPLHFSIRSESSEMIWYLTLMTRVESSPSLPTLVHSLIKSGFPALYFVQRYPELALSSDEYCQPLLIQLANHPSFFSSGSNFGFLERWIYKFVHAEWYPALLTSIQPENYTIQVFQGFKRLFWKAITRPVPSIKVIQDAKLKHECAVELVNHVCTQLLTMSFQKIFHFLQNPVCVMATATANGTPEIIESLLKHFPDLIFYGTQPVTQGNILVTAIECRQKKIVDIIKDISLTITKNLCSRQLEFGNTPLHLAGKLAPPYKLYSVSGAAFQMQRELQWFKVEKLTYPAYKKLRNHIGQTAKEVFRTEHEQLAKQGQKLMKGTANSCMLVSTLIATVLFTVAFTVPGGNVNDRGIPIFLRTNAFTIFAISNALGLFSSLTSLLMFLAILIARYAIDDFFESLPKKLVIGLGSLFVAIVTMIIAFGATLTIVLSEKWHWISMPITLIASFPVAVFVMLQLPLFIQMVKSTYGSGMFYP